MGEGRSHWSSMVLRKSQTCFFDRHTHPSSMYSNFCHVLNPSVKDKAPVIIDSRPNSIVKEYQNSFKSLNYDPKKRQVKIE